MQRLVAKVGEYVKDGQTKGRYTDLGVMISNDNGPYIILDPTVNLAGVLQKQNALNAKNNKPAKDSVMVSVFNNDQNQQPQSGQYNQNQPYGGIPQQPIAQGFQAPPMGQTMQDNYGM
jgi:hypothetical protein